MSVKRAIAEVVFAQVSAGHPMGPNSEKCFEPCTHSHGIASPDGSGRSPARTLDLWATKASISCSRSGPRDVVTASNAEPTSPGHSQPGSPTAVIPSVEAKVAA